MVAGRNEATELVRRGGMVAVLVAAAVVVAGAGHAVGGEPPVHAGAIAVDGRVEVDASSSASGNDAPTLTFSHTVGAGEKRLLVVGVGLEGSYTVSSIRYRGLDLTLLGRRANGPDARAEIWYLVAPPAGTANVVVRLSSKTKVGAGAVSFTGVDPAAPLGAFHSAAGKGETASVTVTDAADGDLIVDAVAVKNAYAASPGGGQTARWNSAYASDVRSRGSTKASPVGGGSTSLSWSVPEEIEWAHAAVAVKPAPPPAPAPITASASEVVADPAAGVAADGAAASTVTIVLRDTNDDPVTGLAGSDFTVSVTGSGNAGAVSESGTPGTYAFAVTNTVVETVTVTVSADGVELEDEPTIEFVAGGGAFAAPVVSAAHSVVTANPSAGLEADGMHASTVTVQLRNAAGDAVAGLGAADFEVAVTGSGTAGPVGETGTPGTYAFDVTDTVAEVVIVTVTAAGVTLAQEPAIEFIVVLRFLEFAQEPTDVRAGEPILPPVTVRLRDGDGAGLPEAGVAVTLRIFDGTGTLAGTTTRHTDAAGRAVFDDLSIDEPGTKRLLASSPLYDPVVSASFEVRPPAPSVAVILPDRVPQGTEGLELEVEGAGFQDAATVSFTGAGISVREVTRVDGARMRVRIDVAEEAAPGGRAIVIANPDGGSTGLGDAVTVVAPDEIAADLGIEVSVSDPSPQVGDTIVFTVVLSNDGPDYALGVEVQAELDRPVTFVRAAVSQGEYDPAERVWRVGVLAARATAVLEITFIVDSQSGAGT